MTRSEFVKAIMVQINDDDILVTSTGLISREVYHQRDRVLNFYMLGSMGNALAIGIGLALHLENRVFVFNGDGSALMGLGAMVTEKSLNMTNLYHFILDNSCHESTGGQKTNSKFIEFDEFGNNTLLFSLKKDNTTPPRIDVSCEFISKRFKDAVQSICRKRV
jgi:thiamine pyrophosphate-dependent acetolactate synthase large subunit-like protein